MEAQYLMNAPQLYINNVAVGAINWNTSAAATVYDGLTVTQCVKPRSRFFGDELKVIKKDGREQKRQCLCLVPPSLPARVCFHCWTEGRNGSI